MNFRTEINIQTSDYQININNQILTIGSCFADVIGQQLTENKFKVLSNPFGVVFNPHSIFKLLQLAFEKSKADSSQVIENQGIWNHYDFHSSFSSNNPEVLLENINQQIDKTHYFLQNTDILIITFGTTWIYELIDNQLIVANCHKQKAQLFEKKLLKISEIVEEFSELYQNLKKLKPNLKIIFTISPVRHIKDTIPLNNLSKSLLRVVCHEIISQFKDTFYFPAYEILMDDLRDYRFYEADMIHPNKTAENYIWEKFGQTFFDLETQNFLKKWQKIHQALSHRPFQVASQAHQKFLQNLLTEILQIQNTISVSEEIQFVQNQLRNQSF